MRYTLFENQKDAVILVARILLMVLFVMFGWSKLTGFSGTVAYMTSTGAPVPELSAIIAVVMEFVVGIALRCGFLYAAACTAARSLYAGHGDHRPPLLEHDGCGAVRKHDQLLQERQHHGRIVPVEHDRARQVFDRPALRLHCRYSISATKNPPGLARADFSLHEADDASRQTAPARAHELPAGYSTAPCCLDNARPRAGSSRETIAAAHTRA